MQAAETYKGLLTNDWISQSRRRKSAQTHYPADINKTDMSSMQATELGCTWIQSLTRSPSQQSTLKTFLTLYLFHKLSSQYFDFPPNNIPFLGPHFPCIYWLDTSPVSVITLKPFVHNMQKKEGIWEWGKESCESLTGAPGQQPSTQQPPSLSNPSDRNAHINDVFVSRVIALGLHWFCSWSARWVVFWIIRL